MIRQITIKGLIRRISTIIAILLYYSLARYLPGSFDPIGFGLTNPFRAMLCRFMFKKCGRHITVERGAWFGFFSIWGWGFDIEIGDYSGIGENARVGGGLVIGKYVMMGPEVVILTGTHRYDDVTRPMMLQGGEASRVIIEDDVWIGARVIILPNVRIGRSSIIGAGAVVAKDVPPFSVVVGNPAKVIRMREGSAATAESET
jgi:maltose O-acetyltransferase